MIAWFAISYAITGNFVRLIQQGGVPARGSILAVVQWIALVSLIVLIAAPNRSNRAEDHSCQECWFI